MAFSLDNVHMPLENVFGIERLPRITDWNANRAKYLLPHLEMVKWELTLISTHGMSQVRLLKPWDHLISVVIKALQHSGEQSCGLALRTSFLIPALGPGFIEAKQLRTLWVLSSILQML